MPGARGSTTFGRSRRAEPRRVRTESRARDGVLASCRDVWIVVRCRARDRIYCGLFRLLLLVAQRVEVSDEIIRLRQLEDIGKGRHLFATVENLRANLR